MEDIKSIDLVLRKWAQSASLRLGAQVWSTYIVTRAHVETLVEPMVGSAVLYIIVLMVLSSLNRSKSSGRERCEQDSEYTMGEICLRGVHSDRSLSERSDQKPMAKALAGPRSRIRTS